MGWGHIYAVCDGMLVARDRAVRATSRQISWVWIAEKWEMCTFFVDGWCGIYKGY